MPADLSVIICSYNGGSGVGRCLRALGRQTAAGRLEILVVDDGSTDNTSTIAQVHGAAVIRHPENRGIAAARNSGILAAAAPIVAFLDDDCEPAPHWAERLLGSYADGIAGVGGPLVPAVGPGFMLEFLTRHNPLTPLELQLAKSGNPLYRLYLYLRGQWAPSNAAGRRDVYSFAGANMSFRREVLTGIGGFDERFQFGAEEVDLCLRLACTSPAARLTFVPDAEVTHYFEPTLRDTLRRSRAYGRGSARLYRKWPSLSPTVFPGPIAVLAAAILSVRLPVFAVGTVILPYLLYPQGVRDLAVRRRISCLLDPLVQLVQEASENVGFADGWWRFRTLVPEPRPGLARVAGAGREAERVS